MGGRQRVPLPAPAEDGVAGQIGLVGDGAVRVAERVRRLAAAVRLDPVADLARRVGGPARRPVALDREVAVGALPVRDPVGADHAGVADVDHVRVGDVEPDPEPEQEDRGGDQHPDRPDGRAARRPVAQADPDAAREQPREPRVDERHRGEDVAVVEEPERDREREQHQQVEVPQRERPPPVDQAEQEDRAEAEPDRVAVDLLAAERPGQAARHRPGDLRARSRPRARRPSTSSTVPGGDLAGLAGEDVDRPAPVRVRRDGGRARRVALEPSDHARVGEEEERRPVARQRRLAGCRDGLLRHGRAGDARARCRRVGRGRGRRHAGHGKRRRESEQRDPKPRRRPQRRNDQSLFPRKLSGVTRTIAIACETTFAQPSQSMKTRSHSWLTQKAVNETTKKRAPWSPKLPLRVGERPVAVPPVVARAATTNEIAAAGWGPRPSSSDVHRQVDEVAEGADDAELRKLDPVGRAPQRLDGTILEHGHDCFEASRGSPRHAPANAV